MITDVPLVSVIMIFRNAERWIEEALRSVVDQDHTRVEIVLVDDGSRDRSSSMAARTVGGFVGHVEWCRHADDAHRGTTASRRLGVRRASGDLIAFLDADDRWDRSRLSGAVDLLRAYPDAGLACGQATTWRSWSGGRNEINGLLGRPGELIRPPGALLRVLEDSSLRTPTCDITVRAPLMRATLRHEVDFAQMYEDQVLLAQLYATQTVVVDGALTSYYRQHRGSTSARAGRAGRYHPVRPNRDRMRYLKWLARYVDEVGGDERLRVAVERELARQGPPLVRRVPILLDLMNVTRGVGRRLLRPHAAGRLRRAAKGMGARASLRLLAAFSPVSRQFGFDRGVPIDRWYIEAFLEQNRDAVHGRVLEVGDDSYTTRYGTAIDRREVVDVTADQGATIVGHLEAEGTLPATKFDAILCIETLQLIYDLDAAVRNLHTALVPGGTLLVTVPGVSTVDRNRESTPQWLWSFTTDSLRRLLEPVFGAGAVQVASHGNAEVAIAFLQGLAVEDVPTAMFARVDAQFPVTVAARCTRRATSSDSGDR